MRRFLRYCSFSCREMVSQDDIGNMYLEAGNHVSLNFISNFNQPWIESSIQQQRLMINAIKPLERAQVRSILRRESATSFCQNIIGRCSALFRLARITVSRKWKVTTNKQGLGSKSLRRFDRPVGGFCRR